ncbi:GNAT family N-acetyltransferase [Streptomyces sp. NPDC005840]|uniref:GNAT family N-acetyltransferase n=1 Tax=Streptomyces sp. NPDC005840 TaxID=3157072 RepID=UPI00340DC209
MRSDDWQLTDDVDHFLARAGDFLRSRRTVHTTWLTLTEKLRTLGVAAHGAGVPLLGRAERDGAVRAAFFSFPASRRLTVTALTAGQADGLAALLIARGHRLTGVTAEEETAAAFAAAWRRRTGATPSVRVRIRLRRLGTLTPPRPVPAGGARSVGEDDHEHLMSWCRAFAADVGEDVTVDAATWAGTRFAEKRYTYWQTPDGTPVSMAGANPMVAGQVRIDPVYTPSHLRGRGYAGAVTVAAVRAALAAGADELVLFTNAANPTSNALYERIGFSPVTDFVAYDFTD